MRKGAREMIISKVFEASTEDLNGVILELAEEIKKGYKVQCIERLPYEMMYREKHLKPCVKITLVNKDYKE